MGADILVIVGAILLLFAGRKIPELLGIGKGAGKFNQSKSHRIKKAKTSPE